MGRAKDTLNFAKQFITGMNESEVVDIFPSPASIKGLREWGYIVTKDTPLKTKLIRVKLST